MLSQSVKIMDSGSNFQMIHWNARSLYCNLSEFKLFLYSYKPHLVCISETWLISSRKPTFVDYVSYRQDRVEGRGGGLLILCRENVKHTLLTLNPFQNNRLDFQAIRIFLTNSTLDVISIYNSHPNNNFVDELVFYLNQLRSPSLICGDFNVRHTAWDSTVRPPISAVAKSFYEFILTQPYSLVTPVGFQTRFNVHSGTYSTLDLSLVSPNLLDSISIKLGRDLGSDHFPVMLTIGIESNLTIRSKRPNWKIKDDSWATWSSNLKILQTTLESSVDDD